LVNTLLDTSLGDPVELVLTPDLDLLLDGSTSKISELGLELFSSNKLLREATFPFKNKNNFNPSALN